MPEDTGARDNRSMNDDSREYRGRTITFKYVLIDPDDTPTPGWMPVIDGKETGSMVPFSKDVAFMIAVEIIDFERGVWLTDFSEMVGRTIEHVDLSSYSGSVAIHFTDGKKMVIDVLHDHLVVDHPGKYIDLEEDDSR